MTIINYNTFFKAHESIIIIKIRKERRKKNIFLPEGCHMINAKYPIGWGKDQEWLLNHWVKIVEK